MNGYTVTVNPPDTASMIYHDAIRRASEAIANYSAMAHSKIECETLADRLRGTIAHSKAGALLTVEGKTEAERNAKVATILAHDEDYQTWVADLADIERRIAECRIAMDIATMEHSIAKRQLDFAAASVRGLS